MNPAIVISHRVGDGVSTIFDWSETEAAASCAVAIACQVIDDQPGDDLSVAGNNIPFLFMAVVNSRIRESAIECY